MCIRKQSIEKENSTLLEHKAYLGMGILLIYHSSLSLSKKGCMLITHRDFLAYVVVCYSCETSWF